MTRQLRVLFLSATLALLTLAGCEGIGRAIVDELPDQPRRRAECLGEPPNCQNAVAVAPPLTPPLSVTLGLEQCASTSSPCAASPAEPGATQPRYDNVQGCSLQLALPEGDAQSLGRASCVVAQLLPPASAKLVRLSDLNVTQSELTLASETPVVVELVRSTLIGTHVTLRGPVTLRLLDQSVLTNVWINEQPASNGSFGASFELVESRALGLTLGALGGRVRVLRSTLSGSKLWADQIALETVSTFDVSLVSPELDGVDIQGRALTLQVGRATLAQLDLTKLDVQRCDALLVVGSHIAGSTFAACTDKLRLHFSAVSESLLAGAIESSVVTWTANVFGGAGAATNVELWGGSQLSNRYCAGVSRVSFGRVVTIECNVCDELPMPEQRLCPAQVDDMTSGPLLLPEDNPFCPTLAELATLPVCSPPVRKEDPF